MCRDRPLESLLKKSLAPLSVPPMEVLVLYALAQVALHWRPRATYAQHGFWGLIGSRLDSGRVWAWFLGLGSTIQRPKGLG
ncbi:hypothetical protein ACFX1Q_015592 [Malus domestica]